MIKLTTSSLDWALVHLKRFSDTDRFPRPFEIDVMDRVWHAFLRDQLASKDMTQHRWQGERKTLVPKDGASFRNASQLDPLDALLFAAIVYEIGGQIEQKRLPLSLGRVLSYRFAPTKDGALFGPDQWESFWTTSIALARTCPVVLRVDISDFYNQISHHSIETQLQRCQVAPPMIKIVMNLLKSSTMAISKGIPIGPHPTHLLAEASLIPIDELLMQRGFPHCRYVDDIHVFCATEEQAQVALFALAGALDEYHKLTLNRAKTAIQGASGFTVEAQRRAVDQPIDINEASVLAVIKKYATGPYTAIPVSQIEQSDIAKLSTDALVGILSSYLGAPHRDYVRLRFFLRRIAQVGVPGAVEFVVQHLQQMLPALAEVADYLNAATPNYDGSWRNIGESLLSVLDSPIARESEYLQIVLLALFGRITSLNHFDKLTGRFASSGPSAQREIVLAAAMAGADAWLRTHKSDYSRYDPWLRRAFAYASRTFPMDEREFWVRQVLPLAATELEKAVLKSI